MARVTVFGAGAMGTAFAMHSARLGHETSLWANPFDERAYESLISRGKHPSLPEHIPSALAVFAPDRMQEAAADCEIGVMAANSNGARSLAQMVAPALSATRTTLISVAKGLEPETGLRISQVYSEEVPGVSIVAVGGPCLAAELAGGSPTAGIWASADLSHASSAGKLFDDRAYQLVFTDDLTGVELCSMMKNVAAIGLGVLDGLGKLTSETYNNAKAALFTKAAHELVELVTALGGRGETVFGLAGLGDQLVTSLGGRNRLFGELVGAGDPPEATLRELESKGLTVEGAASTRDVQRLSSDSGLTLPYHSSIYRILFEGADAREVLEVLR